MKSDQHRFLFVHIPKTAGNAIQSMLAPYADDLIVVLAPHQDGHDRFEVRSSQFGTHKHSTLADYHREYGNDALERLFKFTCVRNPWERALSFWFSPHRGPVTWDRTAFSAFVDTIEPVAAYLGREGGSTPLAECVAEVDFVMRYESLDEDYQAVCGRIGIPYSPLPVRNRSAVRDYRDFYDPGLAAQVARRFGEEVDCFGYRF